MFDKFEGCTGNVRITTMILINPSAIAVLCVHA